MDDHDPQITRVGRGSRLGVMLANVLLVVAAWCVVLILIAGTWRLVEWIWP